MRPTTEEIDTLPAITNSREIINTLVPANVDARAWWLNHRAYAPTPWTSSSAFISRAMIEHLMRDKADTAIGTKSTANSNSGTNRITNMEGVLHSFVVPIVLAQMHGDYYYNTSHRVKLFRHVSGMRSARRVIVSCMIHPDFEDEQVMWRFCSLEQLSGTFASQELVREAQRQSGAFESGQIMPRNLVSMNGYSLADWDRAIKQLTLAHLLQVPSLEIWTHNPEVLIQSSLLDLLKKAIASEAPGEVVRGRKFTLSRTSSPAQEELSLEILFLVVLEQIRNEFSALEYICQETGYIYTYDPAVIFRQALGQIGRELMLLVYVAALRQFALVTPLLHMHIFAYNDFESPEALELLRVALHRQDVQILPKSHLFEGANGLYEPPMRFSSAMLVLHNNSDAFGQNIEFEQGAGSMDAAIGQFSSTASSLRRDRQDLLPEKRMLLWPKLVTNS